MQKAEIVRDWLPRYTGTDLGDFAQHILLIADEVTDYFLQKYPDKDWVEWIDKAIDKIMEITGISQEVAERAIRAALERRGK